VRRNDRGTLDKLLKAGREMFERYGWRDTTVEMIVQQAGVSRGSFYVYFENKHDIFMRVFEPLMDDLFARASARRAGSSIFSRLEIGNRGILELWHEIPEMMGCLTDAARIDPVIGARHEAMRQRFISRAATALARHKAEGITHDIDPSLAAAALAGMVTDFAIRQFSANGSRPGGDRDLVRMSYDLTRLWYQAVYTTKAPPIPDEAWYRRSMLGDDRP
jgi:AcrR family transcriptional regulator